MRLIRAAVMGFALLCAVVANSRADDAAVAARQIIDKALQAQGGAAVLAQWPALTCKIKGTFHGMGGMAPFNGEVAAQGADRYKVAFEIEAGGEKVRLIHVLNKDKGWNKINDETVPMDDDELADMREEAYAEWVASLVPLTGKGFTFAPLGEVQIEQRPALGIKVSSKDHRDVDLYFDKATGLLVKSETRTKDDNGQEVTEETLWSDYRDVQGTKQAHKAVVKRDGKPYLDCEVFDIKLEVKLDESVFAKP